MNKKQFDKIYSKIDIISKKGSIGRIEYYQYVDELVNKNQYLIFQDVLERKYDIDTMIMDSVDNVKKLTFNKIRFQTTSTFQENLKKLYDSYSITQMGQYFYSATGSKIGTIIQTETPTKIIELTSYNIRNQNIIITGATASLLSKYENAINFLLQ